jgi:hypothetical protein
LATAARRISGKKKATSETTFRPNADQHSTNAHHRKAVSAARWSLSAESINHLAVFFLLTNQ